MKAQMSLEALAYLSIAGISLVYSLSIVSSYYAKQSNAISEYEYSNFVEAINTGIMEGASSLHLYVPEGLCNTTSSGESLTTGYGTFYFTEPVVISSRLKCTPGYAEANLSYGQGYFVVS